jgi:hypothetical protein
MNRMKPRKTPEAGETGTILAAPYLEELYLLGYNAT